MKFNTFDITSSTWDTAILEWSISETNENLADYEIEIFRGEDEYNVSGIEVITSGIETSTGTYEDTEIASYQYDKFFNIFYQLKLVNKNDNNIYVLSDVKKINQIEYDWKEKEMIRIDTIFFRNVLQKKFLWLKKKQTGQLCSCYDFTLGRKITPGKCYECYDTTIVGGYYDPVIIYGSLGSVSESKRVSPLLTIQDSGTIFYTLPIPHIKIDDILIDVKGNRWRVTGSNPIKLNFEDLKQMLRVNMVDRGEIIYDIEVNIGDIR